MATQFINGPQWKKYGITHKEIMLIGELDLFLYFHVASASHKEETKNNNKHVNQWNREMPVSRINPS